jgi:transglutaminase-like putative cysteine protease
LEERLKPKNGVLIQVFILAIAAFSMLNPPTARSRASGDLGFYIKSAVTFANEGSGNWNLTREDRSWSCFMNDSWQTVCLTYSAHPLEVMEKDVDGNLLAVLQFESSLQPGENVSDYVVYHVRSKPRSTPNLDAARSGTLTEIPADLQEKYCSGRGFWMTNDAQIRTRAFSIAGSETRVLEIVAKLVSWIWNNIDYKSHDPTLYPNETLSLREGDCDEQSILLGTFCRILAIPSYLQVGCVFIPGDSSSSDSGQVHYEEKQIGWHGWAIVYIPPWGWLPVDLTYVMGSRLDPLNAIRTGAVTSQYTIQSSNVSEENYLASDRAYEQLLETNNFSLYIRDEMKETNPLLGDMNGDNVVNIVDIAIAALAFGSRPNDKNWNSIVDINMNEYVNILDIGTIAREYGKTG